MPHNLVISSDGVATIKSTITQVQESAFANTTQVNQFVVEDGCTACVVDDQGILYNADKTVLLKAPNTLTSIVVPEGVTRIAPGAFYGCADLASIIIPDSVAVIGDQAFKGCDKLYAIALPDSVTDLGNGVFESVQLAMFKAGPALWTDAAVKSKLADFVAEGGVPTINSLWYGLNYSASTLGANYSDSLNKSVTALDFSNYKSTFVPHYAFAGLTGVTEVALPAQVDTIGNGAFYFCTNLKDIYIYNPTAITIATSSGGMGDSGSGDATETYAVSQPGSFAWWNSERQADASGTGAKYEDYTGLNFYGAAYSGNSLVTFCKNMQHNFIPVVILEDLKGADNPFATDSQADYEVTYGTGAYDYGYVKIADITVGETPQVMAYFGDYATPRDLTADAACTVTYYGPDGKATTSFATAGTYTASLEGDGKSVFGERTVTFKVNAVSLSSATVTGVAGKTYTGSAQTQSPVVKVGSATLAAGTDYTVSYKNNVNAGTATMTITGKGNYTGSVSKTFAINAAPISKATLALQYAKKAYTGKALKPALKTAKFNGLALKAGTDYTLSYKNNVKAGKATVTVKGKGNYTGTKALTFTIAKASQKISAKASVAKTYKGKKLVKSKKLAKAQVIKLKSVAKVSAKTTVKYKLASVPAKAKKYIAVNAKTGKLTVKKGLPSGTYKVKVKLTVAKSANYNAAKAKTITVKVVVAKK